MEWVEHRNTAAGEGASGSSQQELHPYVPRLAAVVFISFRLITLKQNTPMFSVCVFITQNPNAETHNSGGVMRAGMLA